MYDQKTLATFGTQYTGQIKQKQNVKKPGKMKSKSNNTTSWNTKKIIVIKLAN